MHPFAWPARAFVAFPQQESCWASICPSELSGLLDCSAGHLHPLAPRKRWLFNIPVPLRDLAPTPGLPPEIAVLPQWLQTGKMGGGRAMMENGGGGMVENGRRKRLQKESVHVDSNTGEPRLIEMIFVHSTSGTRWESTANVGLPVDGGEEARRSRAQSTSSLTPPARDCPPPRPRGVAVLPSPPSYFSRAEFTSLGWPPLSPSRRFP